MLETRTRCKFVNVTKRNLGVHLAISSADALAAIENARRIREDRPDRNLHTPNLGADETTINTSPLLICCQDFLHCSPTPSTAQRSHVLVGRGAERSTRLPQLHRPKCSLKNMSPKHKGSVKEGRRAARLCAFGRGSRTIGEVIKVGHEEYRRTAVVKVSGLVPPLCYPAGVVAVFCSAN